jgi:hypothetical protein
MSTRIYFNLKKLLNLFFNDDRPLRSHRNIKGRNNTLIFLITKITATEHEMTMNCLSFFLSSVSTVNLLKKYRRTEKTANEYTCDIPVSSVA